MIDLYVAVLSKLDGGYRGTAFTAVALFVVKFCRADDQLNLRFIMPSERCSVNLHLQGFGSSETQSKHNCGVASPVLEVCDLPLIVSHHGKLLVSGLCSVLRHLVSIADGHDSVGGGPRSLLGIRQNCLRACSEVSEWTKYCEVILPQLVEKVLSDQVDIGYVIPEALTELENQLSQRPIEASQRRNRRGQKHLQDAEQVKVTGEGMKLESNKLEESSTHSMKDSHSASVEIPNPLNLGEETGRLFVEGNNVQLTDLILFICIQLILSRLDTGLWFEHLPRILRWYCRMANVAGIASAVESAGLLDYHDPALQQAQSLLQNCHLAYQIEDLTFTEVEGRRQLVNDKDECGVTSWPSNEKATISDMATSNMAAIQSRQKPKFKASQALINEGIDKASRAGLLPSVKPVSGMDSLPWETFPDWVLPFTIGGVPDKRARRKLQQLENIAFAVSETIASTRPTPATRPFVIVDFCSGGGHVGILLAHLHPDCEVILVENKEESVRRAVERVESADLANNITVVQCNLGRFRAPFDLGVCLHACGVATDLVLVKCLDARAAFVVTPCCYGAVRDCLLATYPRSSAFCAAGISYLEYLALGHAADQTQSTIAKSEQGRTCMSLVDADRCRLASEHGYKTELCVMTPATCSPKNHVLIGRLTVQ